MNKRRKPTPELPIIENPFEKVTAEQLNHDLIAYLFAEPEEAVYNKLINSENYRIIGGWGSGKTMLLKYISFATQIETSAEKIREADFIGIYIKIGQSGFKPFVKPGGEFKEGGEILFGHYFNLLILERILSIILCGKDKGVFNISSEEEANLTNRILSKFSSVRKKPQIGFSPPRSTGIANLQSLKDKVESWRLEIETFLNISDLEKGLSYKTILSVYPTSIKTFLNEIIQIIKNTAKDLSRKRFYILLDECDLLSKGQQKVVNTIIRQRFIPTMVFKLSSRPPDIKTMETIDEGVGLTDRELGKLYLDEIYDPASESYKDLCYRVAERRLEKCGYPIQDTHKILGKYTIEDEVGRDNVELYLKKEYPNKHRIESNFDKVYNDFKVAAGFQILRNKRLRKKYAGFDTFVMLSSGIMLHFLELCRDAFTFSYGKYITPDEIGGISFKQIPLPIEIQNKAAQKVSQDFYHNIEGRAESLKDSPIDMEFGGKIQYIISVLGGIFREKLMSFNEPEAARIEIPEGISALDDNPNNPIRQLFTTAIAISVFQQNNPYMPQHIGGIRPPTYILNRILAPYYKINPRPRWRTQIPAKVFNKILRVGDGEFKNEVLRRKKKKREEVEEIKKAEPLPAGQLGLPLFQLSESMPVLSYLSNKIENDPFKGKTFLILLHFLRDLVPFMEACKRAGALSFNTTILYKDYQYPAKEEIKDHLERSGHRVYPIKEIDDVLKKLDFERAENIVVVEDGGIIVPKLHRAFGKLATATLGAVEQTTKGIRNDQQIEVLSFPVISIPGSKLKDTFEPPHVARAAVNNIQKLLADKDFSGKKALVIGYGNIGEQIALHFRDILRMKVSVYDLDHTKLLKAQQYGFDTEESLKVGVNEKFLIVGATGETVIGRSEILAMEHNVYLISASSEQWEFYISELHALSSEKVDLHSDGEKIGTRYKIRNTEKYVNLIADGYPINFWKTESMPNEVSDLIMSLIFISAVEIATNTSLPSGINYEITNKLAKRYELDEMYLEYHSK